MLANFSVKQLLQIPSFKNCLLLTGDVGFERKISGFVVVDIIDVFNTIRGGELVCSSAGGFRDPMGLKDRMLDLCKRKASVWAFRLENHDEVIPEDVISLAKELGFPLIAFPPETRWHRVVESVMSHLQEIDKQQREQDHVIRDQLTKLVLSSKGLKSIITFLSNQANNPVILTDRFFNQITHFFSNKIVDEELSKQILSTETKEQLRNIYHFDDIAIRKRKIITTESLLIHNKRINLFMMPIYIEKFFFGWLLLAEVNNFKEYLYNIIMEHGSTVLALELQKEKNQLEALARTKEDFFQSIVEGENLSSQEMQKRTSLLGIYIHKDFVVLVLNVNATLSFHHFQKIESYLLSLDSNATLIESKEELISFFHPRTTSGQISISQETKKVALGLCALLEKDGYSCNIGIGRCYQGFQKISTAYLEAKQTLQKAILENQKVLDYYDLGIERLFSLFLDKSVLLNFSYDVLDALLNYDQKNNSSLYKTLFCYLSNNQNIAKTARDMTLHVNSVNYRLKRIQEILDIDLNNPDTVMMLYFAIKVYQDTEYNK